MSSLLVRLGSRSCDSADCFFGNGSSFTGRIGLHAGHLLGQLDRGGEAAEFVDQAETERVLAGPHATTRDLVDLRGGEPRPSITRVVNVS